MEREQSQRFLPETSSETTSPRRRLAALLAASGAPWAEAARADRLAGDVAAGAVERRRTAAHGPSTGRKFSNDYVATVPNRSKTNP